MNNTNTSANAVTCPSCSHQFEVSAAMESTIREQIETEFNQKKAAFNQKYKDDKAKMEEETARREAQLKQQMQQLEQKQKQHDEEVKKKVEEECSKSKIILKKEAEEQAAHSFNAKIRYLEDQKASTDKELKDSRLKEVELMRLKDAMQKREDEMELEKQRAITAERVRLQEEMRRGEDERFRAREEESAMKLKEKDKQLEDQKRLIEEMKRKAEQGSMQLQGEVQELMLEDMLRVAFPYDTIKEVGKGVRGADCILTVRNAFGTECGCIIFESKRTQAFGPDWIDKLKADMQGCNAEIAVIVTQAFPKEMDRFGERQGVYICNFAEVKSLVGVLRGAILKLYEARKSQENKGDKMVALYDYLTGSEFMTPWNTMRESFANFRSQLQKERDDFEKNWKKKEKMLDLIIRNSLQISGSIEGISGMDSMNWSAIPQENGYLLD